MVTEKTGHGFLRSGMRFTCKYLEIMVLFPFALGLMTARAEIKTWNTTAGQWSDDANWILPGVPASGDNVFITNAGAYVHLTNSTPWLSSLVLSNNNVTMSFSNWDTTLYVTNLTICQGATQTCAGPFTNTAVSNRVSLICSNLVIESGGSINVLGKGFSGGLGSYGNGHGPGGGVRWGNINVGGGGYGGKGANYPGYGGTNYGSITMPLDPGSGGSASGSGSHGGGAVCITAVQVIVSGSINANSSTSTFNSYSSGGSGGGIFINCSTITGTNGIITALGVDSGYTGNPEGGGGGGGGRIAVLYDPAAQSSLSVPSIRFSAAGGCAWRSGVKLETDLTHGDIGTLYFPDSYFLSPTNLFNGQWLIAGFTNWSVSDLWVSNVWVRMLNEGLRVTVTNALTVIGTNLPKTKFDLTNGATLSCGQCLVSRASLLLGRSDTSGPTMYCSGNLTLTNNSVFHVKSWLTNLNAVGYGALVNVGGHLRVGATNCWIYPSAHPTNGAATLFNVGSLTLDYSCGIIADSAGFAGNISTNTGSPAYGPGAPPSYGGAGHGGVGGTGKWGGGSYSTGGPAYSASNAPVEAGSGAIGLSTDGKLRIGACGGGSVQIRASDTVSIQGTISVNGTNGPAETSGGGSGGSIYITCCRFIGYSNGILRANGGKGGVHGALPSDYYGGSGAGGRIAVWRMFDKSTSVISNYVNGGTNGYSTGAPGTIVWGWLTPYGTIFKMH